MTRRNWMKFRLLQGSIFRRQNSHLVADFFSTFVILNLNNCPVTNCFNPQAFIVFIPFSMISYWAQRKETCELFKRSFFPVFQNSPSVSVALATIFKSFSRRLLNSTALGPDLPLYFPVPMETMHWNGSSGHKSLASWIAIEQGLFVRRPPSCE